MSFHAERWAWAQPLPTSEKIVLLKLAHHADSKTHETYPSVRNIADATGLSERQVQRYLKGFVTRGILAIEDNEGGGRGKTRIYRFTYANGVTLPDGEKGDIDEERVTPMTERVTSNDTVSNIERVTPEAAKGDISDEKGDIYARANPEPSVMNHQRELSPPSPSKRKRGELTEAQQDRFDRWYAVYPKKRSKLDAVKAWQKIDPDDALVDRMVAKVAEWADSHEWTKDNGQFVPNPATWLNRGQWEDGSPAPRPQAGATLTFLPGGRDPGQPRLYDHRGNPTPEYWAIKAREEEAKEQQAAGGM